MLSDELFWKFVSRFKNYYNGANKSNKRKYERLCSKLEWLHSYICISDDKNFLHKNNKQLPDLKRGNIILVEIGDNFGMEFSGKHHCIVLRDSPKEQDQVFILPITSKKPKAYNPKYNGIYIEFPKINGFNGFFDKENPYHKDTGKHWANILNVRNISKSRIHYPTKIRNVDDEQLNNISNCIIANIALRRDLIEQNKSSC